MKNNENLQVEAEQKNQQFKDKSKKFITSEEIDNLRKIIEWFDLDIQWMFEDEVEESKMYKKVDLAYKTLEFLESLLDQLQNLKRKDLN